MKQVLTAAMTLIALSLAFVPAHADQVAGVAWTCQIEADLEGFEAGFIVVVKSFEGTGEMRCQSLTGQYYKTFPVSINIKGAGLGFGVSIPNNLKFITGDIGVAHPGYLYGQYSAGVSADGTFIDVGGSVGLNLALSKKGVSARAVVIGGDSEGLLGAVTGSVVSIRPLKN